MFLSSLNDWTCSWSFTYGITIMIVGNDQVLNAGIIVNVGSRQVLSWTHPTTTTTCDTKNKYHHQEQQNNSTNMANTTPSNEDPPNQRLRFETRLQNTPAPIGEFFHDQMERYASKSPSAPAICSWDRNFDFRDLKQYSDRLAHHLRALDVGLNTIVPILSVKCGWVGFTANSPLAKFILLSIAG